MNKLVALALLALPVAAQAQDAVAQAAPDRVAQATNLKRSNYVHRAPGGTCAGTAIYDTTHAATQGAEITAAANGAATSMADKIVLSGSNRFVCEIQVEVFTLTATTPFDLTMRLWTDCSTDGAGGSACGTGPGTLIAGSQVTVTGITPPALGQIFTVAFPYPQLNLTSEADNTISVSINASRSDVFWRINETPVVGSLPAGEPSTSFVERCGSAAANNGCQRNFGVNNNFAIQILAEATPVELQEMKVQ